MPAKQIKMFPENRLSSIPLKFLFFVTDLEYTPPSLVESGSASNSLSQTIKYTFSH